MKIEEFTAQEFNRLVKLEADLVPNHILIDDKYNVLIIDNRHIQLIPSDRQTPPRLEDI